MSISSEMSPSTTVTGPALTRVRTQKLHRTKVNQRFPCWYSPGVSRQAVRAGLLLTQRDNRNSYLSAYIIAILVGPIIPSHNPHPPAMCFSKISKYTFRIKKEGQRAKKRGGEQTKGTVLSSPQF